MRSVPLRQSLNLSPLARLKTSEAMSKITSALASLPLHTRRFTLSNFLPPGFTSVTRYVSVCRLVRSVAPAAEEEEEDAIGRAPR